MEGLWKWKLGIVEKPTTNGICFPVPHSDTDKVEKSPGYHRVSQQDPKGELLKWRNGACGGMNSINKMMIKASFSFLEAGRKRLGYFQVSSEKGHHTATLLIAVARSL